MFCLFIAFASSTTPVYGVIIDAGSSFTRLQTYQWDADDEQQLPLPVGEPGESATPLHLAYYQPEIVEQIFSQIMPAAVNAVPEELQPSTTVYCFGTAGMRGITEDERKAVINATETYLRQNYKFRIAEDSVDTLTPQEEGLYVWLAVNLVKDNFDDGKTTVPVAEMGGMSTCVVFETAATDEKYAKNMYQVAIFGKTFRVFCYSYEQLGIDEGEENYTNSIAQVVGRSMIDAPCYPKEYEASIQYLDINGTGNYDECYKGLSESTLVGADGCGGAFCGFERLAMPNSLSGQNLHGVATFADPVRVFSLTMNLDENIKFAKEFCSQTIGELQEKYDANVSDVHELARYCLKMAYTNNFLVRGLGIAETEDVERIWAGDIVNMSSGENVSVEVGWAYGAILTRTSASLVIDQSKGFSKILAIIIGVVACLIVIAIITGITVKCVRMEKEKDEMRIRQHNNAIFQGQLYEPAAAPQ